MEDHSLRTHEWPNLQKLGLCPGIKSFEDYVQGVTEGEAEASILVLTEPSSIPDAEYIRDVHYAMFRHVHPWAGQFSVPGEDVWFGGMLACDPRYILPELSQLEEHTRTLLGAHESEACARAIAFFPCEIRMDPPV